MGIWKWDGNKEKGKTNTKGEKSWSSYWWGDYVSFDDDVLPRTADKFNNGVEVGRVFKLQNIRNGIANFVKILSGKDIPVRFSSGKQSYTDGDCVTISASTNPEEFDAMVGVALHEASHVLLSSYLFAYAKMIHHARQQFGPVKTDFIRNNHNFNGTRNELGRFFVKYKDYYAVNPKHTIDPNLRGDTKLTRDIHLVLNFLEDRHIDDFVYKTAPGYRPYYEEMYAKYFYNPEVTQYLHSPMAKVQSVSNYLNLLINIHNDKINLDVVPQLRDIVAIVDLPNIARYDGDNKRWENIYGSKNVSDPRFLQDDSLSGKASSYFLRLFSVNTDELPMMLVDAVRILSIIYDNAKVHEENEPPENYEYDNENDESDETDLPNFDGDGGEGEGESDSDREMTESEKARLGKKMARQRRFVRGEMRKRKLEDSESEMMKQIEASRASLENVDVQMKDGDRLRTYKCPVLVLHEVNKRMIMAGLAEGIGRTTPDSYSQAAVNDGIKLGQVLAHRLRIMNDESTMKFTRQDHGRIDKRLIASLGMDNDKVFSTESIVHLKPVMLDISLDASGSMGGEKWRKALMLASAMAYVSTKVRNLRVRVNMRTTQAGSHSTAVVAVIYDSAKDSFDKVRTMWPLLYPGGATPEGLCFAAILSEILEKVKQPRRYFVNVSDGEPAFGTNEFNYSGRPAHEHTRNVVNEIRKAGIKILSYYVSAWGEGSRHSGFETMYGKDAAFINVSQIAGIARTLNKLFLE